MSEDELKGYDMLVRIAVALEGIQEQVRRLNDEGIVLMGDAGINEN